ncbi:MAG TPA: ACT domain-containing protein [Acidimicrobiales bacterium]|nr:ACT domain-containing protein [Acidimicrobiales bacterium]
MATDLRVEAEDSPGQLAAIGGELGKAGINIDGFCAAVAGGRGVVHLLVEDADGARQALQGAGYTVDAAKAALVLSSVEDRPGYLGEMAGRLAEAGVNIEVAYLGTGTRLVLAVDDLDAAQRAL